mgnify:CR=1 FL=1
MTYLFDASAILNIIKYEKTYLLYEQYTLDLALYEIGNAIWKEVNLFHTITLKESEILITSLQVILTKLNIFQIKPDLLKEIIGLASEESLTFYDAAYLYFAIKNGLTLITDDNKLYEKARKHVEVLKSTDLLKLTK